MNVQVPKLARKLGQALEPIKRVHYFGITYDYRCFVFVFVCVFVCVCVCVYACVRARVLYVFPENHLHYLKFYIL